MGQVYRAFDLRLRRPIALKILHEAPSPERMTRLVREARLAASLRHPNIVAVYDVGESEGIAYLSMEMLEGSTLRAAATGASVDAKIKWLADVARGLEAAHRAGLVHRDVKPQNIMVTDAGAKILDFGLAKDLEGKGTALLPSLRTQPGYAMGTLSYMAPEVLVGDHPSDVRTDQFAWGVTAYELLVGPLPKRKDLEPGGKWVAPPVTGLPPRIAGVLERTVSADRSSRFASMAEVVAVLEATSVPLPSTIETVARDEEPESVPDGRGAAQVTRMFAARSFPPPKAEPTKPPPVREPKAKVLAPLVEAAAQLLAGEVPGGFAQAVVIVQLEVDGQRARFFVQIVATDANADLWTPEATPDVGRAAAKVIADDALDGNGRWTRLVLRLQRASREALVLEVV